MSELMAPIKIEGLRELQAALRQMDGQSQKMLRKVGNKAADIVIDEARPHVAHETGKARASLVARSSQRESIVSAGGRRAPYYPWLDFGGKLPRGQQRRWIPGGRYIYPAYTRRHDEILRVLLDGIVEVATDAGLEVT